VGRCAIAPSRPPRPDRGLLAPWERFLPVHRDGTPGRMNAVASHRSIPPVTPLSHTITLLCACRSIPAYSGISVSSSSSVVGCHIA
jgi:hypothetical protein